MRGVASNRHATRGRQWPRPRRAPRAAWILGEPARALAEGVTAVVEPGIARGVLALPDRQGAREPTVPSGDTGEAAREMDDGGDGGEGGEGGDGGVGGDDRGARPALRLSGLGPAVTVAPARRAVEFELRIMTADLPVIVPFRPAFREAFERLNRVWLEEHGLLEPADLVDLQDPERHILATGGQVFFALDGDTVAGTCAAIRTTPTRWELAKLAVDPSAQGRGLGRRLCEVVIRFAREAGAGEMFLTSNTALARAIQLYQSLGFRHAPMPADIRYATADVYMTLRLR
jgi:putative acetyltransferase